MKRSSQISLVLLASVAMTATLSGCDEVPSTPDNGGTFANMAECVAVYDEDTCKSAQTLAQKDHLANAPKYGTREQCIAEYGPDMCAPASNYGGSGNMFMPMMIGYMMGSANSSPAPLYYGPGSYRHRNDRGYNAPIYTSGRGYARQAPIGSAPFVSKKSTVSGKAALNSGTAISSRGGFGTSFKPTTSFKSSYAASNPTSFGRSSYSSGRSYASSSSVSSRGGFGSSGRSFGGGFGG
jgi:uncharacterized protein YgiB involved in biofilm formation